MGVTLILTRDASSAFGEGHDVPRQRHRRLLRRAQERPRACKPLTLTQRAQWQNGLPARRPPAPPRTLHALADARLTRRAPPRAPGPVLRPSGARAHAVAMLTHRGQRFLPGLTTGGARPPTPQRPQDGVTPPPAHRAAPHATSRSAPGPWTCPPPRRLPGRPREAPARRPAPPGPLGGRR
jgi:hypothetical protein